MVAAIVSLSAWLPAAYANAVPAQARTPIFIAHGAYDRVVEASLGRATHAALVARGCAAEWHEYPMEHQVSAQEIASSEAVDVTSWLDEADQTVRATGLYPLME